MAAWCGVGGEGVEPMLGDWSFLDVTAWQKLAPWNELHSNRALRRYLVLEKFKYGSEKQFTSAFTDLKSIHFAAMFLFSTMNCKFFYYWMTIHYKVEWEAAIVRRSVCIHEKIGRSNRKEWIGRGMKLYWTRQGQGPGKGPEKGGFPGISLNFLWTELIYESSFPWATTV